MLPAGLQDGAGLWRADWLGGEALGLDGDEHVGALHEGDGGTFACRLWLTRGTVSTPDSREDSSCLF